MKKVKPLYKLNVNERRKYFKNLGYDISTIQLKDYDDEYDLFIENYLTTFEIPMGIVENVKINDKMYNLLLATEEASIIAGINKVNKIVSRYGKLNGYVFSSYVTGQIIIKDIFDHNKTITLLKNEEENLITLSKTAHPSIYRRGGGIKKIEYQSFGSYLSINISLDAKEAMGANIINTIIEYLSNYLTKELSLNVLTQIVSNYPLYSLVKVNLEVKIENPFISFETAQKITELTNYAKLDHLRATTHNKGILNGLTSMIIASGNDFRANDAGVITYSLKDGRISPLSNWKMNDDNTKLIGELTIPLQLGFVGTNLNKHPKVALFKNLTHIESKNELMITATTAGLLSNFASLLALVTDGIQKGHMRLVNRNNSKI